MRLAEIKKKYPNEWVLVEFSKLDKNLQVKEGRVVAHSKVKEEIYKALLRTKGRDISIEYCGEMPEDLAVMFCFEVTRGSERDISFLPERPFEVLPAQKSLSC